MKQILIADDHEVVRSGLRAVIESRSDWKVVAEAADGREAIALTIEKRPDVAILDYSMPLINGLEVSRQISAHQIDTAVLLFTMHDSQSLVIDALQAGVRGFLLKSDAKKFLVTAVESLLQHQPFFTSSISERLLSTFLATTKNEHATLLTPREQSVVQLVGEGYSNKAAGSILHLSIKTIETHRASAMRKLNINSTAGLVRYAIRNRLIEP